MLSSGTAHHNRIISGYLFYARLCKGTLDDFATIIIINLCVALFVALVFVPAIIDRNGLNRRQEKKHYRRCRRIIKWNKFYNGYITFTQKRKWIYITILVLAFGIPLNLLPQKLDQPYYLYGNKGKPELKWYGSAIQ